MQASRASLSRRTTFTQGTVNMKTWTQASFITITALLSAMLPVAIVGAAKPSTMTLGWHIGDDFLGAFDPNFAVPSVTMASSNGDTIAVKGTGILSVHNKSVSGGGTFVHTLASGEEFAHGTWEATALIAFVSYGDASAQGLPSFLLGGMAKIRVNILVDGNVVATGILNMFCELGNKIPHGAHEGITLVVQDLINFNKQIGGFTVFNVPQ